MDDDLEQRIRVRAFHLWENAGYPEGKDEEFWMKARELELGLTQPAEIEEVPPMANPATFAGF